MRAGELRHRIKIERPVPAEDELGKGALPRWVPIGSRWGDIRQGSAKEIVVARQMGMEVDCIFILRHTNLVTAEHRLKVRDEIFYVTGVVDPDGRRRETHVMCVRRAPANGG